VTTATPGIVIDIAGLTKHYGPVHALTDLTLQVQPGEIFGFLGPNGAGKSTTIRTLLGFLHATSGRASVLGLDVRDESVAIRRRTGYLPAGISFYDSMTGRDALRYLADLQGCPAPRRDELCERLQLSATDLRRRVRDYSRGMRQKLGVIQALQHDPELAIMDEPTEGLDPLMQQAFYRILEDFRASGRTVFFSSHVLPEVERVCNRVAIIRGGRLMALQTLEELLGRRRRNVSMRWRGPLPDLSQVPGLADIAIDGHSASATLLGDVGPFLDAVRGPLLVDLTIEPASLEEAFLDFYAPDAASGGTQ
jgi:ABC-2 type transport system ATP-binding protein